MEEEEPALPVLFIWKRNLEIVYGCTSEILRLVKILPQ